MAYIKSSEKLPKGSYFYIKVGSRFYAGEQIEQKIEEHTPEWKWGDERVSRINSLYAFPRGGYGRARDARDNRKKSLPKYKQPSGRTPTTEVLKFTGRSFSKLVDVQTEAKQFRRKAQAENACTKLKRIYGSLGVNITIELEKGKSNECS